MSVAPAAPQDVFAARRDKPLPLIDVRMPSEYRAIHADGATLVLTGLALGWWVHRGFFGLSAFIGAGLVFAGATGWCGMSVLFSKMPWNRSSS